ncbi:hypothetical protein AQUCO_01300233v1 [Aquilegia coerulea]|uniref:Uncharacterized protein n=1 Tax=Aquilegia coerulea TaxID=218851 RepID=A0A2G5E0D9_AQUCA|nr:hypothetical protein AQUCO_01300233v1 [Aquilegia coerulea]
MHPILSMTTTELSNKPILLATFQKPPLKLVHFLYNYIFLVSKSNFPLSKMGNEETSITITSPHLHPLRSERISHLPNDTIPHRNNRRQQKSEMVRANRTVLRCHSSQFPTALAFTHLSMKKIPIFKFKMKQGSLY